MSIAGMEKVKGAEAAADKIKKSAEEEAARIIADGKRETKELLEQAEKDAEAGYQQILDEAERDAAKLYQERVDEEQQVCEQIKAAGREHLAEVVDLIVGKVEGTYGNS